MNSMIWIIFILLLNLVLWAIIAGLFLRIRADIDFLRAEKEEHIDLVQKFMSSVVTHDDIDRYIDQINSKLSDLSELKQIQSKEKWKKYHMAFGGKEEGKD